MYVDTVTLNMVVFFFSLYSPVVPHSLFVPTQSFFALLLNSVCWNWLCSDQQGVGRKSAFAKQQTDLWKSWWDKQHPEKQLHGKEPHVRLWPCRTWTIGHGFASQHSWLASISPQKKWGVEGGGAELFLPLYFVMGLNFMFWTQKFSV